MGLLVLVVLVVYLALSVYVVMRSVSYAQRRFGRGWVGGILSGLVMYNLVFWDAIPTRYTHHHLCTTEAGLKVYQTPEEWAKENPERYQQALAAAGRKLSRRSGDSPEAIHSWVEYTLGFEREFYHQFERSYAFNTGVSRERVIDKFTGKVLFETLDFHSSAGRNSLAVGANSFADYKFWTVTGNCKRAYPSVAERFKYKGRTYFELAKIIEGWNK